MASASSDSTADTLQHIRRVELAQGITATVAPNISRETVHALQEMAQNLVYCEAHGWMSREPFHVKDGVDYENRDVLCAMCGARMPGAPWPTNSVSLLHRPRCGRCGSSATCPEEKAMA